MCEQFFLNKTKTNNKETKTEMYLSGGISVLCIYMHARESYHVPLVEFMYLVFTHTPGKNYRMRLRSLLCLCDVFRTLINSLVSVWIQKLIGQSDCRYLIAFISCYCLLSSRLTALIKQLIKKLTQE